MEINTDRNVKTWMETDGVLFLKTIGMKKGQAVLDFGCGEGHYAVPAAKLVGEEGKIYAVDRDKQVLDRLATIINENGITNIEFINEESKTSLENSSVDFILCYDVVHYVKNRKIIYDELYRVLRPKGILSLYPKHYRDDYPLEELAHMKLQDIIEEVEAAGFSLQEKSFKRLMHDDYYNDGYILNFRKVSRDAHIF